MATVQDKTERKGLPDVPFKPDSKKPDDNKRADIGLQPHAKALAEFIAQCDTPMTIGIQGDWGSGKTSLMYLIDDELKHHKNRMGKGSRELVPKCRAVWFNTWQYSQFSQQDQLGVSMLWNMVRKIKDLPDKQDKWPSRDTRAKLKRFGLGLVKATSMVAGGVVAGRVGGVAVDGEQLVKAFESDDEQLDAARLFEQMKDDFAGIVQDTLAETKADKIVFYVDDLDRLEPVRAIELVEITKNFIDVPGCVFVLAIDYDVIIQGLVKRKGYQEAKLDDNEGKSFFDKIIQVPYRMPTTAYRSEMFLIENYRELNPGKDVSFFEKNGGRNARRLIAASVGHNPRSIKRLLNLHSLLVTLNRHQGSTGQVRQGVINQLLVLTAIQMANFRMYAMLARNDVIVDHLLIALYLCEMIDEVLVQPEDEDGDEAAEERGLGAVIDAARKTACTEGGVTYSATIDAPGGEEKFEQAVELVRRELIQLRKAKKLNDRVKENMKSLARLMFQCIDSVNENGKFDKVEIENLCRALAVAQSTSVERDDEAAAARRRVSISFLRLSEPAPGQSEPLLPPECELEFSDPYERVADVEWRVRPDVTGSSRMIVFHEGEKRFLSKLTVQIISQLAESKRIDPVNVRKNERIHTKLPYHRYWLIRRGEETYRLSEAVETYKTQLAMEEEQQDAGNGGVATPCCAASDPYQP